MFLMDLIMHSLVKVMYFYPHGFCKAYDTFYFFSVCIFTQIRLEVSESMELTEGKKFVVIGYRWRVEVGTNDTVNKVY